MGEIYTVIWTFYSLGNTWYNQFVQHQRNWLDWVIKINTRNRSTWSWDPALSCPKRPQIRSRQDQIFSSNHRSSFQKRPRFSFVIINSTDFFNLYTITQLGSSFKIRPRRRCKDEIFKVSIDITEEGSNDESSWSGWMPIAKFSSTLRIMTRCYSNNVSQRNDTYACKLQYLDFSSFYSSLYARLTTIEKSPLSSFRNRAKVLCSESKDPRAVNSYY